MPDRSPDFLEFNGKTAEVWDSIAEWWDDRIGDGNVTQDYLVDPSQERLLDLKPGERVLDVACGAGRFTRRMAKAGVSIVAIDQSEAFLNRARQRVLKDANGIADRIDYRVVDATDRDALLALGEGEFDAAVCTMAIMDMASITPLFTALTKLLRPGGRFVWSVTHPAFNSFDARLYAEERYQDGELLIEHGIRISKYVVPEHQQSIGIVGQPRPHDYFDRSISTLLNTGFDAGLVVDGMIEPAIPDEAVAVSVRRTVNWTHIRDLPQVLVVRMRLAG